MFSSSTQPLVSRIFPEKSKPETVVISWKAQNNSYLTRVYLSSVFTFMEHFFQKPTWLQLEYFRSGNSFKNSRFPQVSKENN